MLCRCTLLFLFRPVSLGGDIPLFRRNPSPHLASVSFLLVPLELLLVDPRSSPPFLPPSCASPLREGRRLPSFSSPLPFFRPSSLIRVGGPPSFVIFLPARSNMACYLRSLAGSLVAAAPPLIKMPLINPRQLCFGPPLPTFCNPFSGSQM